MKVHDFIIVGSGCSGAIAAQTLINKGQKVTMLDFGVQNSFASKKIPDKDFISLRENDPQQSTYLIGDKAQGVSWGKVGKGEQITPPRKHILEKVEEYIPVKSSSFSPLESLGYGGLGIGWGLQCWEYSKADMETTGLNPALMKKAYQEVGEQIGIAATNDDAARYTLGSLKGYQDSPRADRNHVYLQQRYRATKTQLNKKGFYLGRTPLALITKDMENRKSYQYKDMDFYSDKDLSAWRPWITIDALRKKPGFTYIDGQFVLSFKEEKEYTEVTTRDTNTDKQNVFRCRKLILASSTLGTARIVLRSFENDTLRLPLLCNPYSYVPCLQPKFFGQEAEKEKLGFTQLSLFFDPNKNNSNVSVGSIYSYQSLMLFRLLRHVPLDFADSSLIMRYLMSGMVIAGIHHPDKQTSNKYVRLSKTSSTPSGDILEASYSLNHDEETLINNREKEFMKALRKLRAYGLKRINPGFGASIHYAGTLPFSTKKEDFTLSPAGRLHGTKSIYVADSSGFKFLPAPGLTFSLMANAHITALKAIKNE